MITTHLAALTVHVLGFVLWIGWLFGTGSLLVARDAESDAGVAAKLGTLAKQAGRGADVGATLAIAGGVAMIANNASFYAHQPWLHAKLTLALVVLGVHGMLRAKTKRGTKVPRIAMPVLAVVAVAIVALAVFKPGLR
jgi:putative membrane protein